MPSPAAVKNLLKPRVLTKTANYTIVEDDHRATLIAGAVDLVFTLPSAVASLTGFEVTVVTATISATTGVSLSPAATDKIQGKGITSVDGKDRINSAATDAVGDLLTLVCDGVDGWWVKNERGTWAQEA